MTDRASAQFRRNLCAKGIWQWAHDLPFQILPGNMPLSSRSSRLHSHELWYNSDRVQRQKHGSLSRRPSCWPVILGVGSQASHRCHFSSNVLRQRSQLSAFPQPLVAILWTYRRSAMAASARSSYFSQSRWLQLHLPQRACHWRWLGTQSTSSYSCDRRKSGASARRTFAWATLRRFHPLPQPY